MSVPGPSSNKEPCCLGPSLPCEIAVAQSAACALLLVQRINIGSAGPRSAVFTQQRFSGRIVDKNWCSAATAGQQREPVSSRAVHQLFRPLQPGEIPQFWPTVAPVIIVGGGGGAGRVNYCFSYLYLFRATQCLLGLRPCRARTAPGRPARSAWPRQCWSPCQPDNN